MRRNNPGMLNNSLNDLDRELSLLRRKRELLEQQQQLLNRQTNNIISPWADPPSNFSMENSMSNRSFSSSNFYDMYGGGDGGRSEPNSYPSRKRYPQPSSWDRPPKRSRPRNKRNDRNFDGPNSHPQPRQPPPRQINLQPRPSPPRPRDAVRPPRPYRGITKPKANKPPNNLNAVPQPQRKQLTAAAVDASDQLVEVLKAGVEPSNLAKGRLELALGEILKQIKANQSLPDPLTPSVLKVVKQAIRDRIRAAMIGKPIDTRTAIIEHYRNKYPDDEEIVRITMKSLPKRKVSAYAYLKQNTPQIVYQQVEDMFAKIKQVYDGVDMSTVMKQLTAEIVEMQKKCDLLFPKDNKNPVDSNQATNDNTLDASMSEIKDTDKTNDSITEADVDDKEKVEDAVQMEDEAKKEGTDDIKGGREYSTERFEELLHSVVTTAIRRHLPHILAKSKHSQAITDMLSKDSSYTAALDNFLRTQGKLLVADEPKGMPNNPEEKDKTATKRADIKYYVKVMGRPKLPKREQLSSFLWKFNPLSIKKHRTVFNLLIIGLGSKEDVDNLLAADGVKFGSNILFIKSSEVRKTDGPPADRDDKATEATKQTAENINESTGEGLDTTTEINNDTADGIGNDTTAEIGNDTTAEIGNDTIVQNDEERPTENEAKTGNDNEATAEKINETVSPAFTDEPKSSEKGSELDCQISELLNNIKSQTESLDEIPNEDKLLEDEGLETVPEEANNKGGEKENSSGEATIDTDQNATGNEPNNKSPVKVTRASSRLATPAKTITTRRSSKQNQA